MNPPNLAPHVYGEKKEALTDSLRAYSRSLSALLSASSVEEIAAAVCEQIVSDHTFALATVAMLRSDESGELDLISGAGRSLGYLVGLELSADSADPRGQGPTGLAIRTAEPQVLTNAEESPIFAPWRDRALAHGIRSSLSLPLFGEWGVRGCLMIYSSQSNAFGSQEVDIFKELSRELSLSLSLIYEREKSANFNYLNLGYDIAIKHKNEGFICIDFSEEKFVKIIDANYAFCRMSGYDADEIFKLDLFDLNNQLTIESIQTFIATLKREGSISSQTVLKRKNGSDLPVDVSVTYSPEMGNVGSAFIRDRSMELERERELKSIREKAERSQSEALEAHRMLVSLSELTLRQIGRDLHDDVGQMISGSALVAASLASKLEAKGAREASQAQLVADVLNNASSRLRDLAKGLYPIGIEGGSLLDMIEELAQSLRKLGIEVSVDVAGKKPPIHTESRLHIYRVLQEATHNVIRHSRATMIWIRAVADNDSLCVTVNDNGIGIPDERLLVVNGGIGLSTMRARAAEMGGSLQIMRPREGGTLVILKVPLL